MTSGPPVHYHFAHMCTMTPCSPVHHEVEEDARGQFHGRRQEEVEEAVAMETGGHDVQREGGEGAGEPERVKHR